MHAMCLLIFLLERCMVLQPAAADIFLQMNHPCLTHSKFPTIKKKLRRLHSLNMHHFLLSVLPFIITATDPLHFHLSTRSFTHLTSSDMPQRSDEWFSLRKDKLTTSTFSTALGFWKGNRRSELWYEKVFSSTTTSFNSAAKAAMGWGMLHKPDAIQQYKSIRGRNMSLLGFAIHAEAKFDWLGASPDGLLGECYPSGWILEVKYPYNKGKPELALPWQAMLYYYMPQVQGQMEIMDRDWVDLYSWTLDGSALFMVVRDREYWELMHGILKDFWWGNVVPARQTMLMGKEAEARVYEPKPKHQLSGLVIGKSKKLVGEARMLRKDFGVHVEFFR